MTLNVLQLNDGIYNVYLCILCIDFLSTKVILTFLTIFNRMKIIKHSKIHTQDLMKNPGLTFGITKMDFPNSNLHTRAS